MVIAAPVIAAGLNLLGGLFGKKSEKDGIKAQNKYNSPAEVRKRFEAAGFNPLLGIAPVDGTQRTAAGGSNIMGSAIASAGLALADGMDKAKMLEIERSRLAMDREKLDALLTNATIRPRSGGIYAGNISAPSAGGVGSASLVPRVVVGLAGGGSVRVGAGVSNADPNQPRSSSDDASKVPVKPLTLFGTQLQPVSNTSDAEAFGSRYGEDFASPGWFAGWAAAGADGAYATKKHFQQRYKDIVGGTQFHMERNSKNIQRKFGADWYQQQAPKAGSYWGQP